MTSENRRARRTFIEIENDIMEATRQLIEENGVTNLSLRGVAKRAGIEVSVFYNRYKDLSELLEKFIERYDYWYKYNDIITSFSRVVPADYPEYSRMLFISLIGALKENESMQQLLLWEMMEDNKITRRANKMREQFTEHIISAIEKYFKEKNLNANPRVISGILIGAIYFLVIYKGKGTFCGINYNNPEGLAMLAEGIRDILDKMFAPDSSSGEILEVAKRMKAKGIDNRTIAECTELTLTEIEQLTLPE